MAKDNQIVDFAHYLRSNFHVDFKDLLDTAKKLKTIDHALLKQANKYLDDKVD